MSDNCQPIPEDLIGAGPAARIAKVHISTLHRWILKGKLRGWRQPGGRYMVSEAELRRSLAPVEPKEEPDVPRTRAQEIAAAEAAKARLRAKGWDV